VVHRAELIEDRVRVRSHQLNRQRTKLVLLEERDRIARDLHDRVIQRIFAAGLQISSLGRVQRKAAANAGSTDVAVADSLDVIAIELDLAIRELRNSIFELTSIDDHEDIEQVVRDIVSRASRILGYMPRVEVSGQIAGIRPDLVAQLASVIQEGLSNVARHAHASAAEVALTATEEHIQVSITDNGSGMPDPLPRSSGISNLLSRARHLGGTATWTPNLPAGTVFEWRVPRDSHGTVEGYGNDTPVALSESSQSPVAST
jgi:signal transduction histidine kinase